MKEYRCRPLLALLKGVVYAALGLAAIVLLFWLGEALSRLFHWLRALHPALMVPGLLCVVSLALAGAEEGAALMGWWR